MKAIIFSATALLLALPLAAQTDLVSFRSGTTIPVLALQEISSGTEITPQFAVQMDITDYRTGSVFIRSGTAVTARVERKKAKGCGKEGSLSVNLISTTSVDGQTVELSGSLYLSGKDHKDLVIGLTVGGAFFIFPFNFFFLLIKGEDVIIPANTVIQAVTTKGYEVYYK